MRKEDENQAFPLARKQSPDVVSCGFNDGLFYGSLGAEEVCWSFLYAGFRFRVYV